MLLSACLLLAAGCKSSNGTQPADSQLPSEPTPATETAPADAPAAPTTEAAPPTGTYNPCTGKACGDTCMVCDPADPDCVETMVVKYCNARGLCTPHSPPCP